MKTAVLGMLLAISPVLVSEHLQAGEVKRSWFLIESARSSSPPRPVDIPYIALEDFSALPDLGCNWRAFGLQFEQKQFVGRNSRVHKAIVGQTTPQLLAELGGQTRESPLGAFALTKEFADELGVTESDALTVRPVVQLPPGIEMSANAMDQRVEFSVLSSGFRWPSQLSDLSAFVFSDPLPASRHQLQGNERMRGAVPPLVLLNGKSDPECAAQLDGLVNVLNSRGINFQVRPIELGV